jgi:hypothetical protein
MATADQGRNQRADEERPHVALLKEAEFRPYSCCVIIFALIFNQTRKSFKRLLAVAPSPREAPLWLMSADARSDDV